MTDAIRPSWVEKPTLAGKAAKAVVLVLVTGLVLLPFYLVVLTSVSSREAVEKANGIVFLPSGFSLDAYRDVLSTGTVSRALLVSVGITAVGTALSLAITALAAYGLSRPGSLWHRPILFLVLVTFLFAPGIIPTYLTVQSLGLLNTYGSLILPGAVAAFHLMVLRTFFMGIPREVIDSARVDGASEFRIFFSIVAPLSKAVLAVIALFYGVGYWNAFFNAMLYLNDNNMWPLQLVLRVYVLQGSPLPGMGTSSAAANALANAPAPMASVKMAVVVLAILPILFVYPFVQRHFSKAVITGAIKG